MASKLFILAALVASACAGGPAAYTISAPSIDGAYVGSSHEHTVKGLYGQNSLSQYTKAVDSAHSHVRVSSSRASNDVLGYAPGYGGHAIAPAIAAPAVKFAAPAIAAPAYAAPAIGLAGHGLGYAAHGLGYAAHGLGYAGHGLGYAGHGLGYATHGYAAPALLGPAAVKIAAPAIAAPAYTTHSYAAPALAGYAAAHQYGTHLTGAAYKVAAAPALSIAHGGPVLGYGALGHGYGALGHGYGALGHGYAASIAPAPLAIKTAVAAAPLVHTSFAGHGAHYAY